MDSELTRIKNTCGNEAILGCSGPGSLSLVNRPRLGLIISSVNLVATPLVAARCPFRERSTPLITLTATVG